ncbi:Ketopantoate reductase PanG [Collimonas arenae]|uniref:Ketopantoate reductase PanG n=1 Tax=Collimonas arenae TaxID=279058 RepID=A0A0A1FDP2_9BURK|nr:Ketopantoate reductase PanG [Collimonas arenae]
MGRLWHRQQVFSLLDVLNRSSDSSRHACAFIGAGDAVASYADLRQADVFLIAAGDDQIAACCSALAAAGKLRPGSIVFHCSGALSSLELVSASELGAVVASIHPIRSFASPQQVADHFSGTWCGSEGDAAALAVLGLAFNAIGAQLVEIQRDQKTLYHAAAVFASNYLVTLIDVAQQAYAAAGIAPELALKMIEPLLIESAANAFRLGPAAALTGPIARGDLATVTRQHQAVQQWQPQVAALYEQFALLTTDLAGRKKNGQS